MLSIRAAPVGAWLVGTKALDLKQPTMLRNGKLLLSLLLF